MLLRVLWVLLRDWGTAEGPLRELNILEVLNITSFQEGGIKDNFPDRLKEINVGLSFRISEKEFN